MNGLFPRDPKCFQGHLFVRIITFVFSLVSVARSGIHLFLPDGGAESIAGIDTSVAGGNNVVALFHPFARWLA